MRLPVGNRAAMQLDGQPKVHALARLGAARLQVLSAARRLTTNHNLHRLRARRLPGGLAAGAAPLGVAAMAAGGIAMSGAGMNTGQQKRLSDFGHPQRRVTDVLLALNVAMFGLQMATKGSMLVWGAKVNPQIAAGQWYRLVTCTCLHANLFHLFTNCQALSALGPFVEATSGPARFTAVYAVSAISGSLFSYWFCPSVSVGASGAVFGLGAATAIVLQRHRHRNQQFSSVMLRSLGQSLLLNVFIGLTIPSIDNWGHAGGLVGGALASFLLGPNRVADSQGQIRDQPPLRLLADKA